MCVCVSTSSDDVLLLLPAEIGSADSLQRAVRPVDFACRGHHTTVASQPSVSVSEHKVSVRPTQTFSGVDPDGDGVLHGGVDGQNHVGEVRDVQGDHPDISPASKDQEPAHPWEDTNKRHIHTHRENTHTHRKHTHTQIRQKKTHTEKWITKRECLSHTEKRGLISIIELVHMDSLNFPSNFCILCNVNTDSMDVRLKVNE